MHTSPCSFQLSINASDLFGNLLNLNQQHRRELNRELREGEDRSKWIFNTFDTNMAVYWSWDEVIVPAGTSAYCYGLKGEESGMWEWWLIVGSTLSCKFRLS